MTEKSDAVIEQSTHKKAWVKPQMEVAPVQSAEMNRGATPDGVGNGGS